jgi:hypothetical protein
LEFHKFEEGIIRKTKETITHGREAIIDFAKNAECLINKKVNNQIANRYMFDVFQPEISKNLSSIGNKEVNELADKKTKSRNRGNNKGSRAKFTNQSNTMLKKWGKYT